MYGYTFSENYNNLRRITFKINVYTKKNINLI